MTPASTLPCQTDRLDGDTLMQMTVTEFGSRAVRLALSGTLDVSAAEKLDLPLAALAGRRRSVVVDMTKLDGIASIAIRHLVSAARALQRGRGQLLLLSLNARVTDALTLAGVESLLRIVRSEDEARARLDPNAGAAAECARAHNSTAATARHLGARPHREQAETMTSITLIVQP
jgi:anti-anti-sigma factor